jgi:hypothetical protein
MMRLLRTCGDCFHTQGTGSGVLRFSERVILIVLVGIRRLSSHAKLKAFLIPSKLNKSFREAAVGRGISVHLILT